MEPKAVFAFLMPIAAAAAVWAMPATSRAGEIFVANTILGGPGTLIGEYTTSGATINPSLIRGSTASIVEFGDHLFVTNSYLNSVSEYTTSGTLINASFITGLSYPFGIAISGGDLFVTNQLFYSTTHAANGTIGEYNATTGVPINTALVSGLVNPTGLVAWGGNLYVVDPYDATVGEYNATTGATINASLVSTGMPNNLLYSIAIMGGDLFLASVGAPSGGVGLGSIEEYDAISGKAVNASLITGLSYPTLAAWEGDLFVTSSFGKISEYTASGTLLNDSLVTGLTEPEAIAVVPEPATWVMLAIGAAGFALAGANGRRAKNSCEEPLIRGNPI